MSILDEIQLPEGSDKEELEQLSKDKLRPLLGIDLFEIREETYRDKGLDLLIELKYKKRYTNFRFLVQLKSTETKKPNSDNSYSWQIDTSNIQYLLNGGLPAYYICYVKKTDSFYYRQLNDFISEISTKKEDWNSQATHILRTSELLTGVAVNEIFEEVKRRCIASRELTEKLQIGKSESISKKVSITSDYNITDESSIVELIEKIGLVSINEGRFKDIVSLNEKVSSDITSPLYNLTVGIAAYYTSNLFDALACFQKASRFRSDLSADLVEHLEYFDALVKYSIGFMNQDEYLTVINSLKKSKHLQFYIQIEQAKERYLDSYNELGFQAFKTELFLIINNENINSNIKFIASCEYLLFWGYRINLNHFQSIAIINAIENEQGPNKDMRIAGARDWFNQNNEWEKFYQELNDEIIEKNDFFAFNMCKLNEVKIRFELIVYASLIAFEKTIPDFPNSSVIDNSSQIETILRNLDKIATNYKNSYHIDNLIATLSTKYEVLHFVKKNNEAKKVADEISELIEFHSLKEQKKKFNFLLNGGTIEENVKKLLANTVEKSKADKAEHQRLVDEMKSFDKLEIEQGDKNIGGVVTVELFPIGHFSIPKNNIDQFYELLEIDSYKLTKHLDYFFDNGIIPVLNIFNNIKVEGHCNGMLDDKGIISWRRIRKIREDLYKLKFKRKIIKYGL
ncbi:MAG: DUF4365 domain-containing protein [Bacteroidales bacterium]|nr:DUF4365 domain-containing protein [Bacteroidales bacterium]